MPSGVYMKRLLSRLLIVFPAAGLSLFVVCVSFSETIVGGSIVANTTWTLAGSPYEVTETVYVSNAARLTIEAGVTVQFSHGTALWIGHPSSDASTSYRGNLTAEGTSDNGILFTSADGLGSGWQGIIFGPRSDDYSSSSLQYCIIEKAGEINSLSHQANVTLYYTGGSGIVFDHVEIKNSDAIGLYAGYSNVNLANGSLSGNGSHGLYAESSVLNVSDTTAENNGGNGYMLWGCGGSISGGQASGNDGHGIAVDNGTLAVFENISLTGNAGYGIYSEDFASCLTARQNRFDGNSDYPARISSQSAFYENTFVNSARTGIEMIGGDITERNVRWYRPGTGDDHPYIHSNITRLRLAKILTVDPGVTVRFATGSGLEIGHPTSDASNDYRGGLLVNGTEAARVLFTSDSGLTGDWRGVTLGPKSDDTLTSALSHLTIEKAGEVNTNGVQANLTLNYAGQNATFTQSRFNGSSGHGVSIDYSRFILSGGEMSGNGDCGIKCNNAVLDVSNTTVSNNHQDGLYCDGSGGSFTESVLNDNGRYGACLNASSLTLAENTIRRSGSYALYYDLENGNPVIESNLLADNAYPGIQVHGGPLAGNHTMAAQAGEPVFTITDAPVSVWYSRELVVLPGVTLRFASGVGLWVGHPDSDGSSDYRGALTAVGSSDAKIRFTSVSGARDGWQGIIFGPRSDDHISSALQYCVIENAGQTNYLGQGANVHLNYTGTGFSVDHVTLSNCGGRGLYSQYSTFNGSGLHVFNNNSDGLGLNFTVGSIVDSIIVNNAAAGIELNESPLSISNSYLANNNHGIYCEGALSPEIHSSVIVDHTGYGVYAVSGVVVDARNNFWGSESGPFDPVDDVASGGLYNPDGTGQPVSNDVDYDPWTGTVPDGDGDGLPDFVEILAGTALDDPDTDGDGLSDVQEIQEGLDALVSNGDDGSSGDDSGDGDDSDGGVSGDDSDDDNGGGSGGCFMNALIPSAL